MALADDDVLLREGLASLLDRSGYEVVGQAGDAEELLALVRAHRPELVIVDIRMPPNHANEGLDGGAGDPLRVPRAGILVLSAYAEVDDAMELLAGGQRIGYLLKSRVTDVADFLATVRRIEQGDSVLDPALVRELVGSPSPQRPARAR